MMENISVKLKQYDDNIREQYGDVIIGCDEAGRGCLAGSFFAAAVALPADFYLDNVMDSKKFHDTKKNTAHEKRLEIAEKIKENALAYAIIEYDVNQVDEFGVHHANKYAMLNAFTLVNNKIYNDLNLKTNICLVDESPVVPSESKHIALHTGYITQHIPLLMFSKAESISFSVAAASLLAKTARDNHILEIAKEFPQYEWEKSKGYINQRHKELIKEYGLCKYHRKSFNINI